MSYHPRYDLMWYKACESSLIENQTCEVIEDVRNLGSTFIDIGCGNGRITSALTDISKKATGLDKNYNNFDLLKDEWPKAYYDVAILCLILVVLNPQEAKYVLAKTIELEPKYIYIFDRNWMGMPIVLKDLICYNHDYLILNNQYDQLYKKNSILHDKKPDWNKLLYVRKSTK